MTIWHDPLSVRHLQGWGLRDKDPGSSQNAQLARGPGNDGSGWRDHQGSGRAGFLPEDKVAFSSLYTFSRNFYQVHTEISANTIVVARIRTWPQATVIRRGQSRGHKGTNKANCEFAGLNANTDGGSLPEESLHSSTFHLSPLS